MINSIQGVANPFLKPAQPAPLPPPTTGPGGPGGGSFVPGIARPGQAPTFSDLVTDLVGAVDAKGKAAQAEVKQLVAGEADNLHQSVIALQEAGLAFNLMVEVRNKLVEAYQELMRMQV